MFRTKLAPLRSSLGVKGADDTVIVPVLTQVPIEVRDALREYARKKGKTLSEWLRDLMHREAGIRPADALTELPPEVALVVRYFFPSEPILHAPDEWEPAHFIVQCDKDDETVGKRWDLLLERLEERGMLSEKFFISAWRVK